jgi:hypothetical protein
MCVHKEMGSELGCLLAELMGQTFGETFDGRFGGVISCIAPAQHQLGNQPLRVGK